MTAAAVKLLPLNACDEAREWVGKSRLSPEKAWAKCERADWMLWLAGRIGVERKVLVLAACDCAEMTPRHKATPSAVECVRVTRLWCEGRVTIEEVRKARRAAAAADAAYAAAAYAAAAAAAAYAAAAAADAAAYAAAAYAAAYAAAAYAAARKSSLKAMAALVRKRISWKMIQEKLAIRGDK